jgi:hypothetical protein
MPSTTAVSAASTGRPVGERPTRSRLRRSDALRVVEGGFGGHSVFVDIRRPHAVGYAKLRQKFGTARRGRGRACRTGVIGGYHQQVVRALQHNAPLRIPQGQTSRRMPTRRSFPVVRVSFEQADRPI